MNENFLSTQPSICTATLQKDKKLIDELASQLGAKVNIVNYATYTAPPEDAFTALHTAAISAGRAVARRLDDPAVYAAAVPWSAVTGELIGLIDVQIRTSEFDASVRSLGWRLAAIALVILCVAVASGLWYGQRLARPLATLRKAADRIGRGDFSVAMPSADIDEIQSLAATMEEMRRNLVELTAVLRRRDAEARAVLSGVVEGVFAPGRRLHQPVGRRPGGGGPVGCGLCGRVTWC